MLRYGEIPVYPPRLSVVQEVVPETGLSIACAAGYLVLVSWAAWGVATMRRGPPNILVSWV